MIKRTASLISAMMAASTVFAATLTVEKDKVLFDTSKDLCGIFFEDIDLSIDGGVYAEKVRNGSFENWEIGRWGKGLPFEYWQTLGACERTIANYKGGEEKFGSRYAFIRARKGCGIANEGYFGIALKKGDSYTLYCRTKGNKAPIEVAFERYGEKPLATTTIPPSKDEWMETTFTFVASGSDDRTRLAFRTTDDDSFAIDAVSLMPDNAVSGIFRRDVVEKLAALRPAFLRFPGGCWVEGDTMKEAYRWKKTLTPRHQRAPQWNIWKYWSSNAVGFFEYLLLCEELHAKPLFCINVGMSHRENVPMDKMDEFVQDAVDAVEFCNGSATSVWGKVRAEMGHPKPFNLEYLEIGNENGGKEYEERYALLANAVREKFPSVKLVFNNWKSTKTMDGAPKDLRDDHFYDSPAKFAHELSHHYDNFEGDFGIFVGEYASQTDVGPWGDLRGAIGEAAFLIGMERNANKVKLAAYAPLFANTEHSVWTPNMLYISSSQVFASPSWTVQRLFACNTGDKVVRCEISDGDENLIASAQIAANGETILKIVNFSEKAVKLETNLSGRALATVLTGNRNDHNSLYDPQAVVETTSSVDMTDGISLPPMSLSIYRF